MDFKNITMGTCIQIRVKELNIPMENICNFLKVEEKAIVEMYDQTSLDTEILLLWSKLLGYDFFRLYSQHLILFSPPASLSLNRSVVTEKQTLDLRFAKNMYTQEIIEFILELIETRQKTKLQIIEEYRIPKTTLSTWIEKYGENSKKNK